MLERDYLSVTPHARLPAAADDSTTVWVETYPELVDAIFSLVSEHRESGVIRLRNWEGNVRQNLSDACDEVSHDDPLGAYAVDRIKPEFVRIATYYEATVSIDYRRTAEQVASVNTVAGSGAIRGELRDALTSFVPETAFRVNYFDQAQGDDYIPRLIRQAYYDSPAAALGLPEAVVNLYPESGQQRVVEVLFTYPEEPELLREKSQALTSAAQVLVDPYRTGPAGFRPHSRPVPRPAGAYRAGRSAGRAAPGAFRIGFHRLCRPGRGPGGQRGAGIGL